MRLAGDTLPEYTSQKIFNMDFLNFSKNLILWLPSRGINIVLILIAAYLVAYVGNKIINRAVRREREYASHGEVQRETTLIKIFGGVLSFIAWSAATMIILRDSGINIGSLLAGAGIIGVALGFGAQSLVRDFLAGLFVILENQYRIGDVICLDSICGNVEDISLRKTVLRDLDGKVYHIPNGSFKVAANLSKDYSRAHMNVRVSYGEDLDRAMALLNRVGKEMAQESPWKEYILKPIQVLGPGPDKFGDDGIEIKVLGETKPLKQWDTLREYRRRLKKAFVEAGIQMPPFH